MCTGTPPFAQDREGQNHKGYLGRSMVRLFAAQRLEPLTKPMDTHLRKPLPWAPVRGGQVWNSHLRQYEVIESSDKCAISLPGK